MTKAIIFDCFGVLTKAHWKDFWVALPDQELRSSARELNKDHDSGLLTLDEFRDKLSKLTNKPMDQISAIFQEVEPTKNLELLEYIRELKVNYKIGLISNVGTSWIDDKLLSRDERELFDSSIYSYQVGMTKPDPEIYLLSANQLKVQPDECIFVDDIEGFCQAAEKLGMKTIVYDTFLDFKKKLAKILAD
jgi:epoxide hydrolase-like predicted phosphatase